ncbi:MAG: class I SAM-dependent methyltransferase [Negativicutes bacterium]|nr:class I SAM-dependent methyltransferase [Negativicutes bacterium]
MVGNKLLLKPRLQAVFDLLQPCAILCDIGTDHAYLPIAAIQQELAGYAYACDLHLPPLRAAEKNIRMHGLSGRIACRQGAGFTPLDEAETGQVVIAGMGGLTIRTILAAAPEKAKKADRLVIQANNHSKEVRQWLGNSGFTIEAETIVQEREFYYQAFAAVYTARCEAWTDLELQYGRFNLQRRDAVVLSLLRRETALLTKALAGMRQARRDVSPASRSAEEQLQLIRQILGESI